jgi:hypothetical protein
MPTVKNVERQIFRREGFRVQFRHKQTGRNVRDGLEGIRSYPYAKMARNKWSVKYWREQRFNQCFPGFNVCVLMYDRSVAHGGTLLATVRDTYLEA